MQILQWLSFPYLEVGIYYEKKKKVVIQAIKEVSIEDYQIVILSPKPTSSRVKPWDSWAHAWLWWP